jgi:hypothetical protein
LLDLQAVTKSNSSEGDSFKTPCPKDYVQLTGTYFGTNRICFDKMSGRYNIGDCGPNAGNSLEVIKEIDESPITLINGTYFCYKRGAYNYHDIAKNRDPRASDRSKARP